MPMTGGKSVGFETWSFVHLGSSTSASDVDDLHPGAVQVMLAAVSKCAEGRQSLTGRDELHARCEMLELI
jgi:hypothetical protein